MILNGVWYYDYNIVIWLKFFELIMLLFDVFVVWNGDKFFL